MSNYMNQNRNTVIKDRINCTQNISIILNSCHEARYHTISRDGCMKLHLEDVDKSIIAGHTIFALQIWREA